jgi:hypothetical protein
MKNGVENALPIPYAQHTYEAKDTFLCEVF